MKRSGLPEHIGIIMDGNGRWAQLRNCKRSDGHAKGAKVFKKIVQCCVDLGIKYLTVYAFSTENWHRPKEEVDALMHLMRRFFKDLEKENSQNTKINIIGDKTALDQDLQEKIAELEEKTKKNTNMVLNIAVSYGGRAEIVNACKNIVLKNININDIDEKTFSEHLYTKKQPDVDLIIRTAAEQRLSNFLLWQSAYAEFVFMDVLWPDFAQEDLYKAIEIYSERNRKMGALNIQN